MVVHAMVHRRLQLLDQLRHTLVPQRKIPKVYELRHRRRVRRPLLALLEPLMIQEVPHPPEDPAGLGLTLALHPSHLHVDFFAVDVEVDVHEEVQLPVIDIAEHRMDEAENALGVFAQHLVQDLPQAASRHLDAPLRDGVLDGSGQNVLRHLAAFGVLRASRRCRLAHHGQENVAASVETKHSHDQQADEGKASPCQEKLSVLAITDSFRQ
mmetsp:Transcript_28196/g.81700  ORF Transcript_28196/g.81700 Transcript_28196/m.81700 type:complete len:211 (+) Transcript_28196:3530-4162(+)